ncbi:high mobility group [Desmophyllum pertusum]|uniref:High mobility group n=1 Tax=Desmophyllum pertusum TaxID=174260 RepID=A0A9W9ZRS9_9CNID|nr:high mobility group [Desmophyllum pertusum]
MSKRGQGSCPQCKLTYYNRSKPEKCSSCSYHLGGSYEPRQKSAKVIPVCVKLFSHGDCTFYSYRTVRTHRCLFIIEGNSAQCLQVKCKLAKSTFNNSHIQGNMFSCEHIAKIKEAVAPLSHHSLNGELIQLYKCDDATRVSLLAIMNSVAMPHFIRLTEELFVVYGVPTSSNPVGYCHMSLKDDRLICSSTDCKGYVSATHQEKNKKISNSSVGEILLQFKLQGNAPSISFDLGLFNISDKLLVSLDILLELREYFKRGVPLTVAIESKLSVLVLKSKEPVPALDYITDLLYNGFYCFEILTDRSLDDQICGICGITGEIYLGDGNQKNCCSRGEISYDPDNSGIAGWSSTFAG